MSVKIGGKLPPGELNGIADLDGRLIDEAHDPRRPTIVCVVELGTRSVKEIVNGDDTEVELRILGIEPIDGPERGFIEATARSSRENRTGVRSLPGFGTVFDPDAEERAVADYAKAGVDRLTGEIDPSGPPDDWEDPDLPKPPDEDPPPKRGKGRPGGQD